MIHAGFEQISALQYKNRSLKKQVEDLKSGEAYRKMEREYKAFVRFRDREMECLKRELAKARSETVTVRKYRGEVMDDPDREVRQEVA